MALLCNAPMSPVTLCISSTICTIIHYALSYTTHYALSYTYHLNPGELCLILFSQPCSTNVRINRHNKTCRISTAECFLLFCSREEWINSKYKLNKTVRFAGLVTQHTMTTRTQDNCYVFYMLMFSVTPLCYFTLMTSDFHVLILLYCCFFTVA